MTKSRIVSGGLVSLWLLVLGASGAAEAATTLYAGVVQSLDKAAGTIVVSDMGPKLKSGESKATPRTIHVRPSTEFVRVKRATGVAPSGWLGDYVEARLPAWEVKPGDWVAVAGERGPKGVMATRITVVEIGEP
jgi:hypothetical protein